MNSSVITCDAARANENGCDDGVDCDANLDAARFASSFYRNRNFLLFFLVLYFCGTQAALMCCVLVHPALPGYDGMLSGVDRRQVEERPRALGPLRKESQKQMHNRSVRTRRLTSSFD
jgi:hypothetical protein